MSRWDPDPAVLAAHERLVQAGILEPLAREGPDVRAWMDLDLASRVEGHFHERLDVETLTAAERTAWWSRVRDEHGGERSPHAWEWLRPYWLLDQGERAGTLALESTVVGHQLVGVSSLYVKPELRRRGVARRALDRTYTEVLGAELRSGWTSQGLRIDTSWTWQPAVRFYARTGFWLRSWKHSLVFIRRADLPEYRVEIEGRRARFLVCADRRWQLLLEAEHQAARLGWTERADDPLLPLFQHDVHWHAPGTLALHLALEGWPLVRSAALWERRHDWCDTGMPEGLAYKIAVFEAVDRQQGFDVRTPRIPGLDYEGALRGP